MKWIVLGAEGRMGKEVCKILEGQNKEICAIDKSEDVLCEDAEGIIDFSTAEDREKYVNFAAKKKIPYACFSTEINQKDKALLETLAQKVPVLMCSNASIGMQFMFEVTKLAKDVLKNADIILQEYHHKKKKDSPSGTAKELLKILEGTNVVANCYRVGNEVGIHKIQFYLENDVLEISHKVSSRTAFAEGAVQMADKLVKQEAGLYKKI